jgi:putative transcriptional regulator
VSAGTISNRIRALRFENGEMSQTELGQRIGLTRQTLAAIEAGKYSPSLEAAFRIAEVFGVDLQQVFQWNSASGKRTMSIAPRLETSSEASGVR